MRVQLGKVCQVRHESLQSKAERQPQTNATARLHLFFRQAGLSSVHHVQDHAAALKVRRTSGGQGKAARAANNQLAAKLFFQPCNLAGDHGSRDILLIGHSGKAARLRHAHEHLHCVEFVHCC